MDHTKLRRLRKRGKQRPTFHQLRLAEIERLLSRRYHHQVPNDDAGRGDLAVLAICAFRASCSPHKKVRIHAPWATNDDIEAFLQEGARLKSARDFALALNLAPGDRKHYRVRTVRSVTCLTDEEVKSARREADRLRQKNKRRAAGAVPRAEYEARSLSRTKPWLALGIARTTYFQRRKKGLLP